MAMQPPDFESLRSQLSTQSELITNSERLGLYSKDTTETIGSCVAALECGNRDDLLATLKFCNQQSLSFTVRGAGTGLSGGATPQRGIVISTTRMNRIRVDPAQQVIKCGPGAITKDIQSAASLHGLTYPPDPASYAESTIAGNIAENAGGLRCKRFGVTRDYVIGLEAILPTGEFLNTGTLSDSRGLNWGDVLTGSEGTLGIITKIELQAIPIPDRGTTILSFFPDVHSAGKAVSRIVAEGIIPTVLEFMDGGAVATVFAELDERADFPASSPVLLIESDSRRDPVQSSRIASLCKESRCTWSRMESDPARSELLWVLRRSLSKAVKKKWPFWLSEDVAVPVSKFSQLVEIAYSLRKPPELEVVCFGHAGDGNLHAVFMLEKDTPAGRLLVDEQVSTLMNETVKLRGTVTGEHGIGLSKREFLTREFDASTIHAMRQFKQLLDPEDRCNPEKIFQ